jgi:hypothetical protein
VKKPKKKKYKKITQEIQSFSRMLRDIISWIEEMPVAGSPQMA